MFPTAKPKRVFRLSGLLILMLFLIGGHLSFAEQGNIVSTGDPTNLIVNDNTNGLPTFSDEDLKKIETQFQQYQDEVINGWESKAIYTQAQLIKGKRDLEKNLNIFSDSDQKIQEYSNILKPLEIKIKTLQDQLNYLDQQVALTQYKIQNVTEQIIEKQEDIKQNMEDLEKSRVEMQQQESILMQYVKLIYSHEQHYYDFSTGEINDLKLFLGDNTISKTLTEGEYLAIIQRTGQKILAELEKVYQAVAEKEVILEDKQARLQNLKAELDTQNISLQQEQGAKQQLLTITQGDEQKYRELMQATEQEKNQAAEEIGRLQDNIANISKALEALRKNARNADDQSLQKKAESAADLSETGSTDSILPFPWPVEPKQGISAYFHDDNYVATFGVDHGAIDIPVPQGTEIHAPADAYVYKAKDNGYGYSYIILAHRDSYLTLYGHVSKILVREGDLVRKGDIIGLSGATPGTPGAGWRTTGAHLHLEIWKDGKKVDPLPYMDLSVLPKNKVRADKLPK